MQSGRTMCVVAAATRAARVEGGVFCSAARKEVTNAPSQAKEPWTPRAEVPGTVDDPPLSLRGGAMAMAAAGALHKMMRGAPKPHEVAVYAALPS